MGPAQAIWTGFAKSLKFSGRASRSEFWWFAPIAILPPVTVGAGSGFLRLDFAEIWRGVAVLIATTPLLAAMSRRMQDIGKPGRTANYAFLPLIEIWVGYVLVTYVGKIWVNIPPGFVFVSFLLGILLALMAFLMSLAAIFSSLLTAFSTIGMMLVPSDPNPNPYGPNPFEVPQ